MTLQEATPRWTWVSPSNTQLIAPCGLYCGACRKHLNGKCLFAFLFNSDRSACIHYIKEYGKDAFAKIMAEEKRMTIKKRK